MTIFATLLHFSDRTFAEIQAASVIFAALVLILGLVGIWAAGGDGEEGRE